MRKGKRSAAPSEILSIKKRIGSEDVDGIRPVCNCDSGSVTAVRYVKSYNLKTAELIRAADTRIQCLLARDLPRFDGQPELQNLLQTKADALANQQHVNIERAAQAFFFHNSTCPVAEFVAELQTAIESKQN